MDASTLYVRVDVRALLCMELYVLFSLLFAFVCSGAALATSSACHTYLKDPLCLSRAVLCLAVPRITQTNCRAVPCTLQVQG
jgi:hypothetical protein